MKTLEAGNSLANIFWPCYSALIPLKISIYALGLPRDNDFLRKDFDMNSKRTHCVNCFSLDSILFLLIVTEEPFLGNYNKVSMSMSNLKSYRIMQNCFNNNQSGFHDCKIIWRCFSPPLTSPCRQENILRIFVQTSPAPSIFCRFLYCQ